VSHGRRSGADNLDDFGILRSGYRCGNGEGQQAQGDSKKLFATEMSHVCGELKLLEKKIENHVSKQ
jgi:hypothetical protein